MEIPDKPEISRPPGMSLANQTEDDGSKTGYERDLGGPTMQIMADLLSYIDQSSKLMPQFESAQSVVQHMASLNKTKNYYLKNWWLTTRARKLSRVPTMQVETKLMG